MLPSRSYSGRQQLLASVRYQVLGRSGSELKLFCRGAEPIQALLRCQLTHLPI